MSSTPGASGTSEASASRLAVVGITRHAIALGGRVVAALPGATLFAPEKFRAEAVAATPGAVCFSGKTGDQVLALFGAFDGIVFIVSLGAVVRLIAPHLGKKESDPGVVVLDEAGRYAIPVLSGHLGGANALAQRLAATLGATAVLTTASDARGTLAVDLLGREFGWRLDGAHDVLVRAAAAMVNDDAVALVQEAGSPHWWAQHAGGRSGALPANLTRFSCLEDFAAAEAAGHGKFAAVLWIARRPLPAAIAPTVADRLVRYWPPQVALGLGCDRATPLDTIARAVAEALDLAGASHHDVAALASIDLKADEAGLAQLAAQHGWTLQFFAAAQLASVAVPNPSETVRRHTGTPSVAEAAALLAAKTSLDAPLTALVVEKHKLRGADGRNATVSVALCSPDQDIP